ncbi:MAG: NAD(P)H-hydrate epimerase, partial [Bacteroidetes bacterium]|nr:NAD(P)H-hydrate epimerase [Bacteroidota bacterium]
MKILSGGQIREADAYTIENEPIASVDLMERASQACVNWLEEKYRDKTNVFHVVCGQGNNGGDGLAISRLLLDSGYLVHIYIVKSKETGSPD